MSSAPPTATAPISARNPETIRRMFGEIAGAYDLANSVLSLGIHKRWKRRLVRRSGAGPGSRGFRVLDCATGTGDLAFLFERAVRGSGEIVGTDFCEDMLMIARAKALRAGSRARFEKADAMALPYADGSFDVASISFGIRNTPDPSRTLAEMARVVRSGGLVLVLEFGTPGVPGLKQAYRFYQRHLLPRIGGLLSGKPDAYRYLEESSAAFPYGERFLELASATGRFAFVRSEALMGGIAYLYTLKTAALAAGEKR